MGRRNRSGPQGLVVDGRSIGIAMSGCKQRGIDGVGKTLDFEQIALCEWRIHCSVLLQEPQSVTRCSSRTQWYGSRHLLQ